MSECCDNFGDNLQMQALKTLVYVSSHVHAQEIEGETVLLDLQSELYFGLDDVGTRVWQLLQQHSDLQKIIKILLQEYNVEQEQLHKDIYLLIEALDNAGLIAQESRDN